MTGNIHSPEGEGCLGRRWPQDMLTQQGGPPKSSQGAGARGLREAEFDPWLLVAG